MVENQSSCDINSDNKDEIVSDTVSARDAIHIEIPKDADLWKSVPSQIIDETDCQSDAGKSTPSSTRFSSPNPSEFDDSGHGGERRLHGGFLKRRRGGCGDVASGNASTIKSNSGAAIISAPRLSVPLSERQQLALLMQLTAPETSDSPKSPTGLSSSGVPGASGLLRGRTKQKLAKVHRRNERGETPLHLAAKRGDYKACRRLIEDGADVNCVDYAGWSPLHEACANGHYKTAKTLIDRGANVNVQSSMDNCSPLHDAASNGHRKVIVLLMRHGADAYLINSSGQTPLDVASSPETTKRLASSKFDLSPSPTPPSSDTEGEREDHKEKLDVDVAASDSIDTVSNTIDDKKFKLESSTNESVSTPCGSKQRKASATVTGNIGDAKPTDATALTLEEQKNSIYEFKRSIGCDSKFTVTSSSLDFKACHLSEQRDSCSSPGFIIESVSQDELKELINIEAALPKASDLFTSNSRGIFEDSKTSSNDGNIMLHNLSIDGEDAEETNGDTIVFPAKDLNGKQIETAASAPKKGSEIQLVTSVVEKDSCNATCVFQNNCNTQSVHSGAGVTLLIPTARSNTSTVRRLLSRAKADKIRQVRSATGESVPLVPFISRSPRGLSRRRAQLTTSRHSLDKDSPATCAAKRRLCSGRNRSRRHKMGMADDVYEFHSSDSEEDVIVKNSSPTKFYQGNSSSNQSESLFGGNALDDDFQMLKHEKQLNRNGDIKFFNTKSCSKSIQLPPDASNNKNLLTSRKRLSEEMMPKYKRGGELNKDSESKEKDSGFNGKDSEKKETETNACVASVQKFASFKISNLKPVSVSCATKASDWDCNKSNTCKLSGVTENFQTNSSVHLCCDAQLTVDSNIIGELQLDNFDQFIKKESVEISGVKIKTETDYDTASKPSCTVSMIPTFGDEKVSFEALDNDLNLSSLEGLKVPPLRIVFPGGQRSDVDFKQSENSVYSFDNQSMPLEGTSVQHRSIPTSISGLSGVVQHSQSQPVLPYVMSGENSPERTVVDSEISNLRAKEDKTSKDNQQRVTRSQVRLHGVQLETRSVQDETSQSSANYMPPRKRKVKVPKEAGETLKSDSPSNLMPTTSNGQRDWSMLAAKNSYEAYRDLRQEVSSNWNTRWIPSVTYHKPPNFESFLLFKKTYLLNERLENSESKQADAPSSLSDALKELFANQESERHRTRQQHQVQREKLVLACEKEVLRAYNRCSRGSIEPPFSFVRLMRESEVYNPLALQKMQVVSQSGDASVAARFTQKQLQCWLHDIQERFAKRKEELLRRHLLECHALRAAQQMAWEQRLRALHFQSGSEANSCDVDASHVPMVEVPDDFSLLPQ